MYLTVEQGSLAIPSGQSLSNSVPLSEAQVLSLWLPSVWTPAPITLVFAGQDGAERTLAVEDGDVVFAAAGGRVLTMSNSMIPAGLTALRVRSGTESSPVPQAALRTILFAARRYS